MHRPVVIDPGHGGEDPGAVGPGGLEEAQVALDVANRVLKKLAGVPVITTRAKDEYVPLRRRVELANAHGACCFVSVHCNSSKSPLASGTETYCFQTGGARGELARRVHGSVVKALGRKDRGIKVGTFYVLARTLMPAVLVELAFISNPEEEQLLRTPEFREKAATAVASGIRSFLKYLEEEKER